jgi:hypothetical protein
LQINGFLLYQQLTTNAANVHPLIAVLVLSWSVSLSWSMELKLLVCASASFPPLKSPHTSFEAIATPKFFIFASWSVDAKLTWLFAFAAKAAGMTAPAATTDSAASKAVVLVDIIVVYNVKVSFIRDSPNISPAIRQKLE